MCSVSSYNKHKKHLYKKTTLESMSGLKLQKTKSMPALTTLRNDFLAKYQSCLQKRETPTKQHKCDYCGKGKGFMFLNIGKDVQSLGLVKNPENVQIFCCKNCIGTYMSAFNLLLEKRNVDKQTSDESIDKNDPDV